MIFCAHLTSSRFLSKRAGQVFQAPEGQTKPLRLGPLRAIGCPGFGAAAALMRAIEIWAGGPAKLSYTGEQIVGGTFALLAVFVTVAAGPAAALTRRTAGDTWQRHREQRRLPQEVLVGDDDVRLRLDLDDHAHLAVLREQHFVDRRRPSL